MDTKVGLVRDEKLLQEMQDFLTKSRLSTTTADSSTQEASNMQLLAQLITTAAICRQESRGAHFRKDYPATNDLSFAKRLVVCQSHYSWLPIEQNIFSFGALPGEQLVAAGN